MKGYVVANIKVLDPVGYERYKAAAPDVIARFGGRYLVKAPEIQQVEGNLDLNRLVILEFDSLEQARNFYFSPDYQRVAADRITSARSDFLLVEGCAGPAEAARGPSQP